MVRFRVVDRDESSLVIEDDWNESLRLSLPSSSVHSHSSFFSTTISDLLCQMNLVNVFSNCSLPSLSFLKTLYTTLLVVLRSS